MLRNECKQGKTKYLTTKKFTICIFNVLYHQYMDLFLRLVDMFFSYLSTKVLMLECLRWLVSVQVIKKILGIINERGV